MGRGGPHDEEAPTHARLSDPETGGGGRFLAQVRTLAEVVRHLEITASTWPTDAQSGFESRLISGSGP